VYNAAIDTTFALYNKHYFDPSNFYCAVRVAGRFTYRHLPWYRDSLPPAEELTVYRQTQKYSYYLSHPTQ
jgi:alpha-acetolactate decarboxylase